MPSSELTQLLQACEVLNLRMQEFEQVLLSLSDRVDRLQCQLEHLEKHAPAGSQKRSDQPQRPRQKRRWGRARRWLLVPLVLLVTASLVTAPTLLAWRGLPLQKPEQVKEQAAALTPRASSLLLRARGQTWLEVQTNTGASLHYGMMAPGLLTFPVDPAIRIRAGRPDLIEIQFKGQTRSLGAVDDTGWHRFALN